MIETAAPVGDRLDVIGAAVRRHWGLILLIALPFPIVVGIASLMSAREYAVSAAFMPQEPSSAVSGLSALTSQLGLAQNRATTGPQFYADLVVSRSMLKDVVLSRYEVPGFRGTLLEYFDAGNDSLRSLIRAERALDRALTVTTNKATGVVTVQVRTRVPALSQAVIERVLALLNDFNLNRRQFSGRAERQFLERRLAIADNMLSRADAELAGFLVRNRNIVNAPILQQQRERLEREIAIRQTAVSTLAQQLEAARTDEIRNTPLITLVERPQDTLEPVGRGTISRTFLALLTGIVIGVAVVALRARREADG